MDTRTKILTETQAVEILNQLRLEGIPLKAVTGYFDVLLASHIQALRDAANGSGKLFALVANPPNPLLTQSARAELAAAVALIDYVIPIPGERAELLNRFEPAEISHLEAGDLARTRELIEHVKRRHNA
ncbi:MAG: hypothetical protein M3Z23_18010 [Acidobacteriota bacterium]|nr:hypothetical protein [Acidobacteriota bacterium]